MTATLAHLPSMDDLKIGPAGETFGQLKQRVLDCRYDFKTALLRGEADDDLMDVYDSAVQVLKAAYIRVGLPYVAP